MTLLDSLLDAIVRLEGDALVMHVGEKPYVVTTSSSMNAYRGPLAWGQVELSSRVLTPDAVLSMVGQILPADQREALEELGAVEHEIASPMGVSDKFSVVAARGGDDIWLELRRHPVTAREGAAEIEAPAATDGAGASEPAGAAASATGQTAGAAVGLQEPPAVPEIPGWPGAQRAGAQPEVDHVGTPPASIETAAVTESSKSAESVEETAIEERVPVFDEIAADEAEHIEHILIPLTRPDLPAETGDSTSLEVIEPEAQHAPTEEDVDAMLAATAASLLSANLKPDSPAVQGTGPGQGSAGADELAAPDTFEVVMDDVELESAAVSEPVVEAGVEPPADLDLTAALDEMPAGPWSPPASAQAPNLPVDTPAQPVAEAQTPTEAGAVPEPIELPKPEPASTAAPAVAKTPRRSREPEDTAAPHAPVKAAPHEQPSTPPEISVDKSVAPPVSPSHAPAQKAPKIAAGAHQTAPGGLVVPIDRAPARPERPDAGGRVDDEALLKVLRVAAERGASTVYVVAQSKPMLRVDGEISAIEEGPALTPADIERLVSTLAPPRAAGTPAAANAEWISEVPQVGRVRCVTFRDHRGPGLIFRVISPRLISADHLNLSPEIRELCTLADGLVLVAGARGSGKSTLLSSFVDLINRARSDHVITVETEIAFVHESRRSFVSQREVPHGSAAAAMAVSAAMREDPDVLVIEDLQSPEVAMLALQAAESGRLVFASINASSSASALEAFVSMVPEAERASVRASLAGVLRAVVAQVLLRRASGGRVAAQELLLNSAAVSASIRDGSAPGVAAALESGQRVGMLPLNDSLAGLVRAGTVHGPEAYRRSPDREALLASLLREGVDTSFAERLA